MIPKLFWVKIYKFWDVPLILLQPLHRGSTLRGYSTLLGKLINPGGAKREKRDQSLTWHHKITDQALAPFARSYYGWFIAQYNTSGIWQNKRCRYAATNQSNCRDRLFRLWLPYSQTKLLPVSNYHTLNPLGRRWDSRWDNRWPNTIWRFSKSK